MEVEDQHLNNLDLRRVPEDGGDTNGSQLSRSREKKIFLFLCTMSIAHACDRRLFICLWCLWPFVSWGKTCFLNLQSSKSIRIAISVTNSTHKQWRLLPNRLLSRQESEWRSSFVIIPEKRSSVHAVAVVNFTRCFCCWWIFLTNEMANVNKQIRGNCHVVFQMNSQTRIDRMCVCRLPRCLIIVCNWSGCLVRMQFLDRPENRNEFESF